METKTTSVILTASETWLLKAIQARTKQTASEILRAGLRDQANRYGIQPPELFQPTIKKTRRRYDETGY